MEWHSLTRDAGQVSKSRNHIDIGTEREQKESGHDRHAVAIYAIQEDLCHSGPLLSARISRCDCGYIKDGKIE